MLRCSLTLISILAAALAGCGGFEASPVPTGDDAFLGGAGGWDESDRLLGMTPEQAAEVMDGHWVDDPSLEAPVLVSNDALLLDGLPCFETASFDGESRVFASFSCSPESQGVAEGVILITGGADGFRRRIAELHVAGDDLVAETEPVSRLDASRRARPAAGVVEAFDQIIEALGESCFAVDHRNHAPDQSEGGRPTHSPGTLPASPSLSRSLRTTNPNRHATSSLARGPERAWDLTTRKDA